MFYGRTILHRDRKIKRVFWGRCKRAGFTALKSGKATDTGLIDADVFSEYLHSLGTVDNPTDQRVTVLAVIAGAGGRFASRLPRYPEMAPLFFRKAA